MADYNDYLKYLHHIDDTTTQEFKKKEDELRHQIDVVRDQCQRDIKNIQERAIAEKEQLKADHKSAIDVLTAQFQASAEELKTEIKRLETSHKAELEKLKAERETAIIKLTNEHKAAMDVALFTAEEKRKSEVQALMKKIKTIESAKNTEAESHTAELRKLNVANEQALKTLKSQYEDLLQQKDGASSALAEQYKKEVAELKRKHEKKIDEINEQNEIKLRGLASQIQSEKDKIKDIEQIWQNKLQLANQEWEKKVKDLQGTIKSITENSSSAQHDYEERISRLNNDLRILRNENNAIRADRYSLSNKYEDIIQRNKELENYNKSLIERVKVLESGIPEMDSKNDLLKFLIVMFILVLIIIFIFT